MSDDPLPVNPLWRVRRRQSPWLRRALIFATVSVLVNSLVGERSLAETVRARREYAQAEARLQDLRRDNASLLDYAARLARDPRTIEAVARGELGLIHPGEVLFVLQPVR
ncbi:MAG: septum formation initiator family protein [Acidobacteria bacterium]|nr:septum formation initiator family protein [Acidobacteriota bacterium]